MNTLAFSQLLGVLVTEPLAWLAVLLLVGCVQLWRGRTLSARRWVTATLLGLLLLGWRGPPDWLMHQLETGYPPAGSDLSGYAGVVVLGGSFERSAVQTGREAVQLGAHVERLTEAVALARSQPLLPIIFTGGCIDDGGGCVPEAVLARRFFTQMGLPPERVRYESASRTTFENALLTARLPGVDRTQPWLLLTSAWHMPRAMASFRAQGWNVTPWPADFRSNTHMPWSSYSLTQGAVQWNLLLHEVVGLLAYRVSGKA